MSKQNNQSNSKKTVFSSIKTKLIAAMGGMVAIPVIVITLLSIRESREVCISQAEAMNNAQAHTVEQSIISVVYQNFRALETLAEAPSTISYLQEEDSGLGEKILLQLKKIDENLNDGNGTILTGADGMQRLRSVGELVDISERDYFQTAMQGQDVVTDVLVSKSTGACSSIFAVPVKDQNGKVLGTVQRSYNLEALHEVLASEVTEEKQELVIVDNVGGVLAHSARELDAENPEEQSGSQFYKDSRGDATTGSYVSKFQGETWMVSWMKEQKTGWVIASCRLQEVALRSINSASIIMLCIGLGFVLAFGVVAFFLSKTFTKPIQEISDSMEALADGRFLEISSFKDRKDEFGDIVRETNSVIGKLRTIVSNIKGSAFSVNESSESLADMTARITQTADDVSNAVQEIAGGATQQAEEIQDAVENTNVISSNIQNVTEQAIAVTQTAEEMSTDSVDSKRQLDRLKVSSKEMGQAIEEITRKISATELAVERISDKVESISSIASQTNLLALNASIEAARAGDMGKGFAVVAEEIGKLADESAMSAEEIRLEMEALVKESQGAVQMAKDVTATTEVEQEQILKDTVKSIEKLIRGIGISVEGIETITESARKCEDSKAGVTDSMNSLSAISEENAAASEETAASMEQLGTIVNSLASDAQSLKEISNSLIQEMQFFKE